MYRCLHDIAYRLDWQLDLGIKQSLTCHFLRIFYWILELLRQCGILSPTHRCCFNEFSWLLFSNIMRYLHNNQCTYMEKWSIRNSTIFPWIILPSSISQSSSSSGYSLRHVRIIISEFVSVWMGIFILMTFCGCFPSDIVRSKTFVIRIGSSASVSSVFKAFVSDTYRK